MKYGEKYKTTLAGMGVEIPCTVTYKRTECGSYHTNNTGDGIWRDGQQIRGTTQFTVAGCRTKKAARAKIRKFVKEYESR